MKVQATVLRNFQATSLADAGAVLDNVLGRARERDDVDVGSVELVTLPGDRTVNPAARLRTGRVRAADPAPGAREATAPSAS